MNLDEIPTLVKFTRLYWNQMGREVYGSVQNALREMLNDGGEQIQGSLRKDLMRIGSSDDYRKWFERAREDIPTIRAVGGRFILPEEVPDLLIVLEEWSGTKPS